MARKRRTHEAMDIAWVSVTDGAAATVNAMAKIEALNQLCLRQWCERRGLKTAAAQARAARVASPRCDEVIGILPIEVQHVHGHHFRVLCVCGPDAAAMIRAVAVAWPSNGRVVSKHLCEAFSISVASACDHDENLGCQESFAIPDLTTKTSGGGNFNGGQTIADVRLRLAHRVLHAGIILHDAFWTRAVNKSNSHPQFDGAIPPFLVYQNRCKNATDLTDGPGFGSVGKTVGEKIAKSAVHWERVWQRRPEKVHVPLCCAAAAAAAVEAPRSPANDDDARSEASTVVAAAAPPAPPPAPPATQAADRCDQVRQVSRSVASAPLLPTTPTAERERALAVAAVKDDYPRAYCLPAHLSRLWAACSQLDGGFGCGGPSPLEIAQGVRSRRWKAPTEAFFRDAPWLTAHLVA